MLQITCPWCGTRAETEFNCGGEGGIVRPTATETLTDAQWGDYLFMRRNRKGAHHEQWRHSSGCGRWFNALRCTVSYRFLAIWKIGDEPPAAAGQAGSGSAA
jgi:sarcosine oxidase subunit delta